MVISIETLHDWTNHRSELGSTIMFRNAVKNYVFRKSPKEHLPFTLDKQTVQNDQPINIDQVANTSETEIPQRYPKRNCKKTMRYGFDT